MDKETDFDIYDALINLNKRINNIEKSMPDYTADMFEIGRNIGVLSKRIAELENNIKKLEQLIEGG